MAYSRIDPAFNPAPPRPILRFGSGKPDAPEPVISAYATGYTQPTLSFGNGALYNGENFMTSVFTGAFGGFPLSGQPVSSWDGAYPVAATPTPGTPTYPSTSDGGAGALDWVQGLAGSIMQGLGIGGDQQTTETLVPVSQPQGGGMDTTTLVLIGGAAVLAFMLLKKG